MNDWKHALWLVKFELKESILHCVALFILAIIFGYFFVLTFPKNFYDSTIGFDTFFLIIFWTCATWTRRKEFQLQKIEEDVWGNVFFNTMQQFPVKRNVLIRSRFLAHYLYSIPCQLLLVMFIYVGSAEVRATIPLDQYLAFSVIWVAFGIASSAMFPASEAGDRISSAAMFIYSILFIVGIVGAVALFYKLAGQGIVSWTLMIAGNWPILSVITSIILVVGSLLYWSRYTYKHMEKMDYLK